MAITFSFAGSSGAPTVEKKSRSLIQFNDEYQANRFYSLLKERLKNRRWTMIDVDRFLMETYGNKYEAGEFSPTWKDWSHTIKPDDVILRSFGGKYATLYFKGVEEESTQREPLDKLFKKQICEDLEASIRDFIRVYPEFNEDLAKNVYLMFQIKDLTPKKAIIFSEVKE